MSRPDSTPGGARFRTTRWGVVRAASAGDASARPALEELAEQYWPPLYALARRRGLAPEDARDATQEFFLSLLSGPILPRADEERGRFRGYVRTCFDRQLADRATAERAEKRGGGRAPLSIDVHDAERLYALEPVDRLSPERAFERRWARSVLDAVLARLEGEYADRDQRARFDALRVHLEADGSAPTHKQSAAALGVTEGSVKVAVHRMRRRFSELLLEEVGHTVADGGDALAEIRELLEALSTPEIPGDA